MDHNPLTWRAGLTRLIKATILATRLSECCIGTMLATAGGACFNCNSSVKEVDHSPFLRPE